MRAFTLIEAIITVAIFSLIFGATVGFIVMLYRTQDYSLQQSVAIDQARRGIETMVKEIREAKYGDNGSYPIEKAADKEFIFYSDIDKDGETEKVRYFLGTAGSGTLTEECLTFDDGGACSVSFDNFFSGELQSAQLKVSVEGDFGWNREYAEVYADAIYLDRVCENNCSDCAATWEGTATFDVFSQASDNSLQVLADANSRVDNFCDWQEPNHAMKVKVELSWQEDFDEGESNFKKGVTDPTGYPVEYPQDQEQVSTLTSYVRNVPPIFKYFDADGNELIELPARLKDTKVMEVYLIVNVDPIRLPQDFELKSSVQLRNLKQE